VRSVSGRRTVANSPGAGAVGNARRSRGGAVGVAEDCWANGGVAAEPVSASPRGASPPTTLATKTVINHTVDRIDAFRLLTKQPFPNSTANAAGPTHTDRL
jgi:hypothetical protein